MDDKIIIKINDILSKKNPDRSCEEKILESHKIFMEYRLNRKIKEKGSTAINLDSAKTFATYTTGKWKLELAKTIATYFSCNVYVEKEKSSRVMFLGESPDTIICKMVYEFAFKYVKEISGCMRKQLYKRSISARGFEEYYGITLANKLNKSLSSEKTCCIVGKQALKKSKVVNKAYKIMLSYGR